MTDRVTEFDTYDIVESLLKDFIYMIKTDYLIKSPLWRERTDFKKTSCMNQWSVFGS